MRFLLATAALASLLLAGGTAYAQDASEEEEPLSLVPMSVGRCHELSASMPGASGDADSGQTMMDGTLMSALPAQAAAPDQLRSALPYTPVMLVCMSPDDPGCRVSAPMPRPSRTVLDQMDHGFAPPPTPVAVPVAVEVAPVLHASVVEGSVRSAHAQPPWRPPARA